ncbi:MAG: Vitamin B12 dependent methionine synthase activation subunit [Hungatella sp.]|jgi:hypothetical protein|nr:Vitamin B12 dependent methionine synthase activation subunit [Hungatella sp.]
MNVKETLRYLGYKGCQADRQTLSLVEDCWQRLEETAVRRSCYQEYPLTFGADGTLDLGCFRTASRDLRKNLKGCEAVVLFAATLGAAVDSLIRRYSRLEMARAVVLQAAAAAMLEDYCDEINGEIRREYERQGLFLRPRFSPGYGDFSLECQPALLGGLEAGKRVGIALTEGFLMAPSKSVTAVIGVGADKGCAASEGCGTCKKRDCAYRRGEI